MLSIMRQVKAFLRHGSHSQAKIRIHTGLGRVSPVVYLSYSDVGHLFLSAHSLYE